jgi:hypothetical protein
VNAEVGMVQELSHSASDVNDDTDDTGLGNGDKSE